MKEFKIKSESAAKKGIPESSNKAWHVVTMYEISGHPVFMCDCPASKFSGIECKHIKEVRKMLKMEVSDGVGL